MSSLTFGAGVVMADRSNTRLATFFGSKPIEVYDQLGTAKHNQNGLMPFYPYGEERVTVNDSLKFATYTRDTAMGLDYAGQGIMPRSHLLA